MTYDLARPDPGASTSAQLRETQAALAASQADLTRVQRERDDALHELAHATFELAMAKTQRDHWKQQAKPEEES